MKTKFLYLFMVLTILLGSGLVSRAEAPGCLGCYVFGYPTGYSWITEIAGECWSESENKFCFFIVTCLTNGSHDCITLYCGQSGPPSGDCIRIPNPE